MLTMLIGLTSETDDHVFYSFFLVDRLHIFFRRCSLPGTMDTNTNQLNTI